MSNAVMPLSDYKDTCDKIREKTASTDNIKSGELADKVNEVYEKGKQAEYDKFWDSYQENGNKTNYNGAFCGYGWTKDNFKPKYPIKPKQACYMFYWTRPEIDLSQIDIDFSECTELQATFMSSNIPRIDVIIDGSKTTTCANIFGYNPHIKYIKGFISNANANWATAFINARNLEHIVFSGEIGKSISFAQSTLLDKESIQSIISCLSSNTSGTTLTLSKTAVNNAFEGGSTGTEWLNLVATKPNWTISLS